jgi:hypothetical protein
MSTEGIELHKCCLDRRLPVSATILQQLSSLKHAVKQPAINDIRSIARHLQTQNPNPRTQCRLCKLTTRAKTDWRRGGYLHASEPARLGSGFKLSYLRLLGSIEAAVWEEIGPEEIRIEVIRVAQAGNYWLVREVLEM